MKKSGILIKLFIVISLFLISSTPTFAAKKRVWSKNVSVPSTSNKFSISAKFTGWKQYLNISFKGVAATTGINYDLIYSSKGIDQGLNGRVDPAEGNITRSVFLGTCSHGACTAHKNISDVRLKVSYTTNGQTINKSYKVKY